MPRSGRSSYARSSSTRSRSRSKSAVPMSMMPRKVRELVREAKNEQMVLDYTASGTFTTAGVVLPLNLSTQGDTDETRSGDTINMHQLYLNLLFTATAPSLTNPPTFRVIVFYDKMFTTGYVAPLVLEVLNASTVTAHPYHDNRDRFDILYDRTRSLPVPYWNYAAAAPYGGADSEHISVSLNGRVTQYLGVAASQINVGNGGLYVLLVADTAQPVWSLASRVLASK